MTRVGKAPQGQAGGVVHSASQSLALAHKQENLEGVNPLSPGRPKHQKVVPLHKDVDLELGVVVVLYDVDAVAVRGRLPGWEVSIVGILPGHRLCARRVGGGGE